MQQSTHLCCSPTIGACTPSVEPRPNRKQPTQSTTSSLCPRTDDVLCMSCIHTYIPYHATATSIEAPSSRPRCPTFSPMVHHAHSTPSLARPCLLRFAGPLLMPAATGVGKSLRRPAAWPRIADVAPRQWLVSPRHGSVSWSCTVLPPRL
jgi:hypothetical protein